MQKLYRFEGRCDNDHRWISPISVEPEPLIKVCPTCGVDLSGFMRMELTGKFNFSLEAADFMGSWGGISQEKRYYVSIQNQSGKSLARSCHCFSWDDGVAELSKIKDINQKMLLKLLKNKNWSVY